MPKSWNAFQPAIVLAGTIASAIVLAAATPVWAAAQGTPAAPVGTPDKKPADDSSVVPVSVVPLPSEAPPAVNVFTPEHKSGVDTVNRIIAVVGKTAITYSELLAAVYNRVAEGMPMPRTAEGQYELGDSILSDLVNQELLVQKAPDLKVDVDEQEVSAMADQQVRRARANFQSDAEFRSELQKAGLGTPEEYRKSIIDQARRYQLQKKVVEEMRKTTKPGSVTDEEVDSAYARVKDQLGRRPALVTFRQLVITPKPSPAEDSAAKAKAQAILDKLRAGADFAETAKRESMDPGSKDQGGDLGWNRRGGNFVPEFERAMLQLRPGEMSGLVKTSFGYHIIKVDRVQPAEVKVRHILIAPKMDSADVTRAHQLADSVAGAWRAGADFEKLVAKFHDPAEEKAVLQPFPIDSLPASYKAAVDGLRENQVSAPFTLSSPSGSVKFAIIQILTKTGVGEYSLSEVRETLRSQLAEEKQIGAILDRLRRETYVSLRFHHTT